MPVPRAGRAPGELAGAGARRAGLVHRHDDGRSSARCSPTRRASPTRCRAARRRRPRSPTRSRRSAHRDSRTSRPCCSTTRRSTPATAALVQRTFTPRALTWMEPLVADVAEELAAALPDGGPVDFIEAFARPLPVWAISRVLGLADERRDDVRRWTDAATATIGAQLPRRALAGRSSASCSTSSGRSRRARAAARRPGRRPAQRARAGRRDRTGEDRSASANSSTSPANSWSPATRAACACSPTSSGSSTDGPRSGRGCAPTRSAPGASSRRPCGSPARPPPCSAASSRDTTLGGVELPAGATLVVSVLSANRDEAVFRTATGSTPTGRRRSGTSRSGRARTPASGTRWPGWRRGMRCRPRPARRAHRGRPRPRCATCPAWSSGVSPTCRCECAAGRGATTGG